MVMLVKSVRLAGLWHGKGAIAATGLLLLSSCGGGTPTTEDAQATLCGNLKLFGESLQTLASIDRSSSVTELNDALNSVNTSLSAVKQSAAEVKEAKINELDRAYQNLDEAVKEIPNDATLADAFSSIEDELKAVEDAESQMGIDLNCSDAAQ